MTPNNKEEKKCSACKIVEKCFKKGMPVPKALLHERGYCYSIKPFIEEDICEKNCPDYNGMEILHKEQCDCSCHAPHTEPQEKGISACSDVEKEYFPVPVHNGVQDDWESIKQKYSQSGWFDNVYDIKELDSDIKALLQAREEKVLREEYQFFINVLNGIDIADEVMGNTGGGTKAIRHSLQSRLAGHGISLTNE